MGLTVDDEGVTLNSSFDQLRPQLADLDSWLAAWNVDAEDQRKLYLAIVEVASDASEDEQAYQYLLKALRTTQDAQDASGDEARSLSIRALLEEADARTDDEAAAETDAE